MVFEVLETSVVNARDCIVRYGVGDVDTRKQLLALLEVELRQGHEACQSLRRRL